MERGDGAQYSSTPTLQSFSFKEVYHARHDESGADLRL